MGANSSTRKITLVNDEKAGVIKLSESLAHRLRGQIVSEKNSIASVSEKASHQHITPAPLPTPSLPPTPPPSPPPAVELHQKLAVNDVPQSHGPSGTTTSGESMPPWSMYAREAHLLASRLREEKDLELQLKDNEWRKKIKARELEYVAMAKLTEDNMNQTMQEVENLFMKASCNPVCQNQQENVMKCYQDHPSQSLRCSDQVENFARCVDLSRLQSFMKEKSLKVAT